MVQRKRKHGISLLIPTQNVEKTVEMCLMSFKNFADEMIVVDNGSKDKTKQIVRRLEKKIPHMRFFDVPELPDLYQNRQYALERSQYNWIVRIDSDYVACTSGPCDIQKLRQWLLNLQPSFWPYAIGITQVNLIHNFFHTGMEREKRAGRREGRGVTFPVTRLAARIIQYFHGMDFRRLGRWEGVRFQNFLRPKQLKIPYWFQCQFKTEMGFFYRSERTNWRQQGNFKKYPTLDSYIRDIIKTKYGTDDIHKACRDYMDQKFYPYLQKYDPQKYYPYPDFIKKAIGQGII